jgi:mannose-1-phosphate guanylyltransferase
MYHALIMAGGTGTRLWPQSRYQRPKQLLKLIGDRTMFEHAVDRLHPLFPLDRIHVIARDELNKTLSSLAADIPASNFIAEPEGRGTAPAIGLGALHLQHRDPDATMVVLAADHFIADTAGFREVLANAAHAAQAGHLVTLGIQPSFPSTGYGYIRHGTALTNIGGQRVFRVLRFTEKPDLPTAEQMLASGEYSWNSGMFIWRVDRIMEEFRVQMPALYAHLMEIAAAIGTPHYATTIASVWPQIEKQTIDYGIMERADDIVVLPADIGWTDVGSWHSLFDVLPATGKGNVVVGDHIGVDSRGSLVMGGKRLIATIGVEDLVIVDTEDALLVCTKDRAQDVRDIVARLRDAGRDDLL